MASVTALILFDQGGPGTPGQVFVGFTGSLVTVTNDDNTNVNSWQIDLVYTPPGSSVPVATPLAFNDADSTPTASFTPTLNIPGSYRVVLTVWAVVNRIGKSYDVDIRNFVIVSPNGLVVPPYMKDPDKLPTLASGRPGAKPNEMNINGTELGWAGDGTDGLLAQAIALIGGGGGASLATTLGIGNTTGIDAYTAGNDIRLSAGNSLRTADGLNPGDPGVDLIVSAGDGGAVNGTGGNSYFTGGQGTGIGNGGSTFIAAGQGAAAGGDGGTLQLVSGGGINGSGGPVTIAAGGSLAVGNGGQINLYSGGAVGGGIRQGGDIILLCGDSAGTGTGAKVDVKAGNSGTGLTGNGGPVNITGGSATSTDGDGGDIVLTPGAKTGSGTVGEVHVVGKLTVDGLIDPTGLVLDEQASAPFDPTGLNKGLLYVKSGAPNTLQFRNDAGTDAPVQVGTPTTPTLAQVMTAGNTTPGGATNPLQFASGDFVRILGDGNPFAIIYSAPATTNGGSINIQAQQGGGATGNGGSASLVSGAGVGTGLSGDIVLNLGERGDSVSGPSGNIILSQNSAGEIVRFRKSGGSLINSDILADFSGLGQTTLTLGYLAANTSPTGPGGHISITAQSGGTSGTGGQANLKAGVGGTIGVGGTTTISGGPGGTVSGNGGDVTVQGGDPISGAGGAVNITVPNSTGSNIAGGAVTIEAGNGSGTSTGGTVLLVHGTSTSNGGVAFCAGTSVSQFMRIQRDPTGAIKQYLDTGSSTGVTNEIAYVNVSTGVGNTLNITGQPGAASSNGGAVRVLAGSGGGTAGTGGAVTVQGGTGSVGSGGAAVLEGGTATSGAGGAVTVQGGVSVSGDGGAVTISGRAGVGGNNAGGTVTITGGAATGTGTAGTLDITAGASGAGATGNGAKVEIRGGASAATNGNGGISRVRGGAGSGSGSGGEASILAGAAGATGVGGDVTIFSGAGGATSGASGNVTISSNSATNGSTGNLNITTSNAPATNNTAGNILIQAGNSAGTGNGPTVTLTAGNSGGGATGNGGTLTLNGGDAASANGDGGSIVFIPGAKTGSGTTGSVQLQDSASVTKIEVNTIGIGFFAATPVGRQTYVVTNPVVDRSYDTTTVTTQNLAEVVGTIIADLQSYGLMA